MLSSDAAAETEISELLHDSSLVKILMSTSGGTICFTYTLFVMINNPFILGIGFLLTLLNPPLSSSY